MIDLDQVKLALPFMLEKLGCHPQVQGDKLTALCPLHPDRKPSFTARFINGVWLWKCWPCDLGGDAIDLAAYVLNLPGKSAEAIKGAAELAGLPDHSKVHHSSLIRRKMNRAPILKAKPSLPGNFETIQRITRLRVFESLEIQQTIADEFGVTAETIKSLCSPGDGIGWSKKHQRPLYRYQHGIKIRNHATAQVRFRWLIGRSENPWRANSMTPSEITRVFLTEGESDAIALLNAGLEFLSPKEGEVGTAIVASPGTSFKAEWAPLFTGKDLIICPDNDTAGDKAATKIADLCRPYTNSTSRVKWNVPTQTK